MSSRASTHRSTRAAAEEAVRSRLERHRLDPFEVPATLGDRAGRPAGRLKSLMIMAAAPFAIAAACVASPSVAQADGPVAGGSPGEGLPPAGAAPTPPPPAPVDPNNDGDPTNDTMPGNETPADWAASQEPEAPPPPPEPEPPPPPPEEPAGDPPGLTEEAAEAGSLALAGESAPSAPQELGEPEKPEEPEPTAAPVVDDGPAEYDPATFHGETGETTAADGPDKVEVPDEATAAQRDLDAWNAQQAGDGDSDTQALPGSDENPVPEDPVPPVQAAPGPTDTDTNDDSSNETRVDAAGPSEGDDRGVVNTVLDAASQNAAVIGLGVPSPGATPPPVGTRDAAGNVRTENGWLDDDNPDDPNDTGTGNFLADGAPGWESTDGHVLLTPEGRELGPDGSGGFWVPKDSQGVTETGDPLMPNLADPDGGLVPTSAENGDVQFTDGAWRNNVTGEQLLVPGGGELNEDGTNGVWTPGDAPDENVTGVNSSGVGALRGAPGAQEVNTGKGTWSPVSDEQASQIVTANERAAETRRRAEAEMAAGNTSRGPSDLVDGAESARSSEIDAILHVPDGALPARVQAGGPSAAAEPGTVPVALSGRGPNLPNPDNANDVSGPAGEWDADGSLPGWQPPAPGAAPPGAPAAVPELPARLTAANTVDYRNSLTAEQRARFDAAVETGALRLDPVNGDALPNGRDPSAAPLIPQDESTWANPPPPTVQPDDPTRVGQRTDLLHWIQTGLEGQRLTRENYVAAGLDPEDPRVTDHYRYLDQLPAEQQRAAVDRAGDVLSEEQQAAVCGDRHNCANFMSELSPQARQTALTGTDHPGNSTELPLAGGLAGPPVPVADGASEQARAEAELATSFAQRAQSGAIIPLAVRDRYEENLAALRAGDPPPDAPRTPDEQRNHDLALGALALQSAYDETSPQMRGYETPDQQPGGSVIPSTVVLSDAAGAEAVGPLAPRTPGLPSLPADFAPAPVTLESQARRKAFELGLDQLQHEDGPTAQELDPLPHLAYGDETARYERKEIVEGREVWVPVTDSEFDTVNSVNPTYAAEAYRPTANHDAVAERATAEQRDRAIELYTLQNIGWGEPQQPMEGAPGQQIEIPTYTEAERQAARDRYNELFGSPAGPATLAQDRMVRPPVEVLLAAGGAHQPELASLQDPLASARRYSGAAEGQNGDGTRVHGADDRHPGATEQLAVVPLESDNLFGGAEIGPGGRDQDAADIANALSELGNNLPQPFHVGEDENGVTGSLKMLFNGGVDLADGLLKMPQFALTAASNADTSLSNYLSDGNRSALGRPIRLSSEAIPEIGESPSGAGVRNNPFVENYLKTIPFQSTLGRSPQENDDLYSEYPITQLFTDCGAACMVLPIKVAREATGLSAAGSLIERGMVRLGDRARARAMARSDLPRGGSTTSSPQPLPDASVSTPEPVAEPAAPDRFAVSRDRILDDDPAQALLDAGPEDPASAVAATPLELANARLADRPSRSSRSRHA